MSVVDDKYRGKKEYVLVYLELITAARYRGTTTYPHLAALMGIQTTGNHMQNQVGWILGEITDDEVRNGRPMLSAVVVGINSGVPGEGFYRLASLLGLFQGESEGDKLAFWNSQREAVYRAWKRDPYPQPKSKTTSE